MTRSGSRLRFLPVGVLLLALASSVESAEWTTAARIRPELVYTDNVCLESDNKQDEWIGVVTPSVSLQGDGARADVNISGSLKFNTLGEEGTTCATGLGDSQILFQA